MMSYFLAQLYAIALPIALTFIAAFLARVLAAAAKVAQDRWGIEIEATHRDALHSALMSGIRAALSRGLTGQAVVDAAVAHARGSVPDALAHLNPAAEVLANLAKSKLREAVEKTPFIGIDHMAGGGTGK